MLKMLKCYYEKPFVKVFWQLAAVPIRISNIVLEMKAISDFRGFLEDYQSEKGHKITFNQFTVEPIVYDETKGSVEAADSLPNNE